MNNSFKNKKLFLFFVRFSVALIVLFLAILAVFGLFYKIKIFDIQFLPLIEKSLVDFSFISLILLITVLTLTFFFGRIYCSTLCPLGTVQELISLIVRKNNNKFQKNLPIKYFFIAVLGGSFIGGTTLLLRYFEPYTFFVSAVSLSLVGIVGVFAIIILTVFKNKYFCANLCPVGATLGIISKMARFKINLNKVMCKSCGACEKICPTGSINSKEKIVNNETCIKCLKCLTVCPKNGINFSKTTISNKNIKFNPSRRDFIITGSLLAVFAGMVKTGIVLKNIIAEKINDLILPPGAENETRLLNKCLNCNLCVLNCPQNIIKKADKNFPVVRLDYEKNFCEFDCNYCQNVCPTGAIKRMPIEDKQRLRIGMATINQNLCDFCKLCEFVCPMHAIIEQDKKIVIDSAKCIGCGACKFKCPNNAIKIFAVQKQKFL